jgi:hypothetical protein
VRPDKNKAAAASGPRPEGVRERTDLTATLHVLQRDLDRLLAFLDTYERSGHPARIEALRWLQPALERHLRILKRQRKKLSRKYRKHKVR